MLWYAVSELTRLNDLTHVKNLEMWNQINAIDDTDGINIFSNWLSLDKNPILFFAVFGRSEKYYLYQIICQAMMWRPKTASHYLIKSDKLRCTLSVSPGFSVLMIKFVTLFLKKPYDCM